MKMNNEKFKMDLFLFYYHNKSRNKISMPTLIKASQK